MVYSIVSIWPTHILNCIQIYMAEKQAVPNYIILGRNVYNMLKFNHEHEFGGIENEPTNY